MSLIYQKLECDMYLIYCKLECDMFQTQVLETLLYLRISHVDIQSLKQHNEKKSTVELKIEKNKNRMEKKLKGKMSKKEKKVQYFFIRPIMYTL